MKKKYAELKRIIVTYYCPYLEKDIEREFERWDFRSWNYVNESLMESDGGIDLFFKCICGKKHEITIQ